MVKIKELCKQTFILNFLFFWWSKFSNSQNWSESWTWKEFNFLIKFLVIEVAWFSIFSEVWNKFNNFTGVRNKFNNFTEVRNKFNNFTGVRNKCNNFIGVRNKFNNFTGVRNKFNNFTIVRNKFRHRYYWFFCFLDASHKFTLNWLI